MCIRIAHLSSARAPVTTMCACTRVHIRGHVHGSHSPDVFFFCLQHIYIYRYISVYIYIHFSLAQRGRVVRPLCEAEQMTANDARACIFQAQFEDEFIIVYYTCTHLCCGVGARLLGCVGGWVGGWVVGCVGYARYGWRVMRSSEMLRCTRCPAICIYQYVDTHDRVHGR